MEQNGMSAVYSGILNDEYCFLQHLLEENNSSGTVDKVAELPERINEIK
jgi:hypothetical protein